MVPDDNPVDGWDTWAKHILKEQERLSVGMEGCRKAITEQSKEIAELRATLAGYLAHVKDLGHDTDVLRDCLAQFKVSVSRELGTLQAKSGIWGALGALVVLLITWLVSRLGG